VYFLVCLSVLQLSPLAALTFVIGCAKSNIQVGNGFIQTINIMTNATPELRFICYTKQSLKALKSWGTISYMDGTHNVLQDKMQLIKNPQKGTHTLLK